jgi:predicted phage terminase large subunit-like protein
VIELPAILPSGKPLWPEYWSLESLHALKAELPAAKWNAQYQQLPTSEDGAILKREWWRRWEHKKPPEVELVMVSVDTAYTRNTKSDYSAFTVWGVFQQADDHGVTVPNLILLDAFQDRLEFPALKARAMEVYTEWEPDVFLVEAKASGLPLIHEMRHMGILVSEFTPSRASGDKIMRANSVTDLFASGVIWAPETKWADDLIETCAAFPNGDHDDLVDSTVMALMRYRQGGFIRLASDYDADYDKAPERRRHVEPYY